MYSDTYNHIIHIGMSEETEIFIVYRARDAVACRSINSTVYSASERQSTRILQQRYGGKFIYIYKCNNNIILNCNADYPQVLTAYIYI